jgi:hypothetical protein
VASDQVVRDSQRSGTVPTRPRLVPTPARLIRQALKRRGFALLEFLVSRSRDLEHFVAQP